MLAMFNKMYKDKQSSIDIKDCFFYLKKVINNNNAYYR